MIKFVSDLWKVGCFFGFPTNKTARYDITEALLKVALNTIIITINLLTTFVYKRIKSNITPNAFDIPC